tara:strand:+ start:771 stop:1280 length:510 start_codon:yes stop_codon:yes gene_type:complete
MKVTKTRLKQIIAEEMDNLRRNPNGGTSLSEAPDRLIMQYQNDAKGAAMGLLKAGEDMAGAGSTDSASEYASYVIKQANIIVDAMVALEKHNQGGDDLAEGDDHSRTITQIEKIGDEIVQMAGLTEDPAILDRLEYLDEMITDLVAQMQGVEPAPLPHMAADGAKSVPQ